MGAAADHGRPAERSSRLPSGRVLARHIADPGPTDPAGAELRGDRAVAKRRRVRAVGRRARAVGRRARAVALAVAVAAAARTAAAVRRLHRTGSGPRAIRTETVPRPARSQDLAVRSPLAADAAVECPNPAGAEAAAVAAPAERAPAGHRETLPADLDAGARRRVPAVPKQELVARHTHPAEAADPRGPQAPAG